MRQQRSHRFLALNPAPGARHIDRTAITGLRSSEEPECITSPSSSDVDRLLFDGFLRLRSNCRGAAVGLNERIMITNPSAAEVLLPSDRARLWALARDLLAEGGKSGEFVLSSGVSARARYVAITVGDTIVGALVQLSNPFRAHVRSRSAAATPPCPQVANWQSLTNAERAVAEAVASGLTNREAGRRFYVSAHTVDAHLRQIFRKLSINSRVELAAWSASIIMSFTLPTHCRRPLESRIPLEDECTPSARPSCIRPAAHNVLRKV